MTDEQQMHSESPQAEQAAPALDFAPMTTPESPVVVDPAAPVNMLASNTGEHGSSAVPLPASAAVLDDTTVEQGLARLDPLTVRPRISSRVLCVVFALMMAAMAAGVWWLGVCTEDGQAYDDMVWSHLAERLPDWLDPVVGVFTVSLVVQIISAVLAVGAVIVAIVRKRWWLLGQSAVFAVLCFASSLLKQLPRPFIIHVEAPEANSAPSGHTILAAAAGIALLCVVPRAWRALTGVIGAVFALLVGASVVVGKWHRPTDVVMALCIAGAMAMLTLAFTRTSGMDEPGKRASSPTVQIVGTVMITGGVLLLAYTAYVIWQIVPGLELSAEWCIEGACVSAMTGVSGMALLVFGMTLAMRQITLRR
ncbi:PAP2 superfamily protein [Bifidobacterium pullorum subsp. saeculare DSM 6531 = LMG 14934]|uniref:PAP2 superfamily protein n=1 Tax=Bifidobacterium pullorum subsp. saeculare DSM 6531 = LMG 14934 TaxID=1437611 RepID=A0A087CZD6_9BIFI|nr:PAP2 superfamily protein [Bifidobacterium pullorum subsp. saeculare DSM 6531 = LMG 14934]